MSLNSIQNYGLKTASLACHGIGYSVEAATEVAKTAKMVGISVATILTGLLTINAIKSVVHDDSTVTEFKFPTQLSEFCSETTHSVWENVMKTNEDGTSFEQGEWVDKTSDPCGSYNINTNQILFPIVFVATMHLLAKASPLIAKNAHDLGNYFGDLSSRNFTPINN